MSAEDNVLLKLGDSQGETVCRDGKSRYVHSSPIEYPGYPHHFCRLGQLGPVLPETYFTGMKRWLDNPLNGGL